MTGLFDCFQRPINYLRISITDRCNQRCIYCMPPEGVLLSPHQDILSYEEIHTIVRAAAELGMNKIRLTGGEPLLRSGVSELIRMIARIESIDDISLTTNGILLGQYAAELKSAGLRRVNVSLDTLNQAKFEFITRSENKLSDVLQGIELARSVGLNPVKLNMVVMAGINDDEITDFAAKTINDDWHVRFIEFMPITSHDGVTSPFMSVSDIKKRLEPLGKLEPSPPRVGNGPAKYYCLPGAKGSIGFITPVSEHFCFQCNRLRLTTDGKLRLCLLAEETIDLKQPLRSGISLAELKKLIEKAVSSKPLRHYLAEGYLPKGQPFSKIGG